MPTSYAATLDDMRAAAARIIPFAHVTPVMTCQTLDRLAGCSLFFKCEQWQKAGAFKFRGACNAVQKLSAAAAARGVITHSSGNHAQALALAARQRGVPAHIIMPENASAVKRRAVEDYGGKVTACAPTLEARETTTAAVQARTGAVLIPPYNHPDIIAGQGTVALELLDQVNDLDALVAPIGGGGLVAGIAIAAKALRPTIRVFAAEPSGADDAARSKAQGTLIPQMNPKTIADGLLTSMGDLTWPVVRDLVDAVITVREEEIKAALRLTWERAKLLIEPSSAVAVAAVLGEAIPKKFHRIGVVLSGGNVSLPEIT